MPIPALWRKRAITQMAKTLGGNNELSRLQAAADLRHICNSTSSFHKTLKAVYEYTRLDKPLSYILESVPFSRLNLKIRPPILIPRPETEHWAEWMIENIDCDNKRILDIGTGSGCIALCLGKAFPRSQIMGIDISEKAVRLARENAALNNVLNVTFEKVDFANYTANQQFDIIVSNPPYIPSRRRLPKSVRCFEDRRALFSGHDGMEMIEVLIKKAEQLLTRPSKLLFEFDAPNCEKVKHLLSSNNLRYKIQNDQFNRPRLAVVSFD